MGSNSNIWVCMIVEQEALRASPVSASPNNAQSTDISSKIVSHEVHETIKSLNEKLSAALFSISAKEDLVKQHVKVAEEAVAGINLYNPASQCHDSYAPLSNIIHW